MPSTTLWIGQLPPGTSEESLRQTFSPFGQVDSVKVSFPLLSSPLPLFSHFHSFTFSSPFFFGLFSMPCWFILFYLSLVPFASYHHHHHHHITIISPSYHHHSIMMILWMPFRVGQWCTIYTGCKTTHDTQYDTIDMI